MSISYFHGRLTAVEKIQLQFAAAIIAADEEEQIQLYTGGHPGGEIIVVELSENQVLLEGPELYELGCLVKKLKGSCVLSLDRPPAPALEFNSSPTKPKILPAETLFDDNSEDDDDSANGWKRGEA